MPMPLPLSIFTCTWTRSHTHAYTQTCVRYRKAVGLQWRKVTQSIRPTILRLASSQATARLSVSSVECRMRFFIDCDGVQTYKIPHLNSRLTDVPCHITTHAYLLHTTYISVLVCVCVIGCKCRNLCCLHYSAEVAPPYQVSKRPTHKRIHPYISASNCFLASAGTHIIHTHTYRHVVVTVAQVANQPTHPAGQPTQVNSTQLKRSEKAKKKKSKTKRDDSRNIKWQTLKR